MIEIVAVPAFTDNYIWMMHDHASGETAVIDPAVAEPVLEAAAARGWRIGQILNTHWHPDHVGGNLAIKTATGCSIAGPAAEADRIPGIDVQLSEGDDVRVGAHVAEIWEVPGHTLGHIAFIFRSLATAFVGDTLFAMGCGRLFEGTAAQMHKSLLRFAALPRDTAVYCAHEYTLANARFAASVDAANPALGARFDEVAAKRAAGIITLPSSIGAELDTNPFLRARDAAEFGRLRLAKDSFS